MDDILFDLLAGDDGKVSISKFWAVSIYIYTSRLISSTLS